MLENKKKEQMKIIYPNTLVSTDEIEVYGEVEEELLTETNPFEMAKRQVDIVAQKMGLNDNIKKS